MNTEQKKQLVEFVLSRTNVQDFNRATKEFSVQMLYSKHKRGLKAAFHNLMHGGDLYYSIAMSEAFKEYEVNQIKCKGLQRKLNSLRDAAKCRSMNYQSRQEAAKEHDTLVKQFNQLLEPQQRLIKEFRRIRKSSKRVA